MLPIINLHPADMNALYSLLSFISDQSKNLDVVNPPTVTFDQPLYVKAVEIALSMNMDIIVRLGGFHQLMSFLGSIGCVMEGSGLQNALGTVYVPLTVVHMLTGKVYSRAIRGHILAFSAFTSMLLEEFWSDLTDEEKYHYEILYDSDPLGNENEKLADKLCSWYIQKKPELTSSSRTAALWLNYIQYIHIDQIFIRTERTSNWSLHIAATKSMFNLFAAIGHNNYARTGRIYVRSMEEIQKQHPLLFEQFLLGNHTAKRSEKKWAGIWTDLSIEQILMKSLKGRGGVIGRGMS